MAMYLRFRKRDDSDYVLVNMDTVLRIEAGDAAANEPAWSRLIHALPGNGQSTMVETDVLISLEELSSMLAGVWEKSTE